MLPSDQEVIDAAKDHWLGMFTGYTPLPQPTVECELTVSDLRQMLRYVPTEAEINRSLHLIHEIATTLDAAGISPMPSMSGDCKHTNNQASSDSGGE